MAMKLIRKKAPRGALVCWLSEEEETAVKNCFGWDKPTNQYERRLADSVLLKMRQLDAWLQCSCIANDSPALNSAKLRQESQKLFLAGFNHPHDVACPMFRRFKEDEGATSSGTRKTAGSRRISYLDFLPPDESTATVRTPGRPVIASNDRTRRKRLPRIARLLLTLIDDAGLNRLSTLCPLPSQNVKKSIEALAAIADQQEFISGRQLSDIVRFQPGLSDNGKEKLMQSLEQDAHWPASRARLFFQIFVSDQVSRDEVVFKWANGKMRFAPQRGVSINGESQDGVRPPYWIILAFRRGTDGSVICSEGYAHALFRRECPIPVDSDLERQTLVGISAVAQWLSKKPGTPILTLEKPLFDTEVEVDGVKGFVLPDFIVVAKTPDEKRHTVIIETMGYTDDEYCERKSEQHKGMKRIGRLQTDPPYWPQKTDKAFKNHLYGVLSHLG